MLRRRYLQPPKIAFAYAMLYEPVSQAAAVFVSRMRYQLMPAVADTPAGCQAA